MKKAAILARVSTNLQEYTRQIEELRIYSQEHGFTVPDEYIFGEKITGADNPEDKDRESIENLKKAIATRKDIEAIFIWELTRLSRNPFYLVDKIREFNTLKVPTYISTMDICTLKTITRKNSKGEEETFIEEDIDSTNKIFGAATYGQFERLKIKQRTTSGRLSKARLGRYVGHIAYGYSAKYENKGRDKFIVVNEEEKTIVQQVFRMYIEENQSTLSIARYLNDNNILTRNAKMASLNKDNKSFEQIYNQKNRIPKLKENIKWSKSLIRQMLMCEWYIGKRFYKGEEYKVESIIDIETFNEAARKLKRNQSIAPSIKSNYLLSNLLYCGKCGSKMYGHKVKISSSYYCGSSESGNKCGSRGICKENIEGIVWSLTKFLAKGDPVSGYNKIATSFKLNEEDINLTKETISNNKNKINKKKQKISELIQYIENAINEKIISKDTLIKNIYDKKIKDYLKEKSIYENEIREIEANNIFLTNKLKKQENIDELFDEIDKIKDLKQIKKILQTVITKILSYHITNRYKVIEITYIDNRIIYIVYDAWNKERTYVHSYHFPITYNPSNQLFEFTEGFTRVMKSINTLYFLGDEEQDKLKREFYYKEEEIDLEYEKHFNHLEALKIFDTNVNKMQYELLENIKENPLYDQLQDTYKKYWKISNERKKAKRLEQHKEHIPLTLEQLKERKKEYQRRYKERKKLGLV